MWWWGKEMCARPTSAKWAIGFGRLFCVATLFPGWWCVQNEKSKTECSSGCTCSQQSPSTVIDAPVADTPSVSAAHSPLGAPRSRTSGFASVLADSAAASVARVAASSAVGAAHAPAVRRHRDGPSHGPTSYSPSRRRPRISYTYLPPPATYHVRMLVALSSKYALEWVVGAHVSTIEQLWALRKFFVTEAHVSYSLPSLPIVCDAVDPLAGASTVFSRVSRRESAAYRSPSAIRATATCGAHVTCAATAVTTTASGACATGAKLASPPPKT